MTVQPQKPKVCHKRHGCSQPKTKCMPKILHSTVSVPKTKFSRPLTLTNTHTQTHPFNSPLSGTTRLSWYQKGKTNLNFTEARDSEWQWHQLGRMQVCTSLQTDNHASTPPLSCLQAGCPFCRPTNSVKALKARRRHWSNKYLLNKYRLERILVYKTKATTTEIHHT